MVDLVMKKFFMLKMVFRFFYFYRRQELECGSTNVKLACKNQSLWDECILKSTGEKVS